MRVACEKCGTSSLFPEEYVGRRAKCNKCGAEFTLEKPTSPTAKPTQSNESPQPHNPPQLIEQTFKRWKLVLLLGGLGVITGATLVILVVVSKGAGPLVYILGCGWGRALEAAGPLLVIFLCLFLGSVMMALLRWCSQDSPSISRWFGKLIRSILNGGRK